MAKVNMFLLPNLFTRNPEKGIAQNCPTGMVKSKEPSCASERESAFLMSAMRVAQHEKPMPKRKKKAAAAILDRSIKWMGKSEKLRSCIYFKNYNQTSPRTKSQFQRSHAIRQNYFRKYYTPNKKRRRKSAALIWWK